MINKSKPIAGLVFYIGLFIAVFFGVGSISYIANLPEYTATSFLIVLFGILPAIVGLVIAYMGSYMHRKNKRFKSWRRH